MPLFRLPAAMDLWLPAYLRQAPRRWFGRGGEVHVLLCVADHYEPNLGGASEAVAARRVEQWVTDYPRQLGEFRTHGAQSVRIVHIRGTVQGDHHVRSIGAASLSVTGFRGLGK